MKLSAALFDANLQTYIAARRIYIAYSGGIDSHVLLHLCANIQQFSGKLVAVHVHHGLQASADAWSQHCQQIAQQLRVEFILLPVNAQPDPGQSPEEAARIARYTALAAVLEADDLLLVAQHREDQYETILLQMLRGAGLAGISGMPSQTPLGKGTMLRPLLAVAKQAMVAYASTQSLQWVEDESNQADDFDRNYLRNQITPLLKARWPAADKTIARAGWHCAQAAQCLDEMTVTNFLSIYCPEDRSIAISGLLGFDRYQQPLIIRHWFKVLALRMPATKIIGQILEAIIPARVDADPQLNYQHGAVRRYRSKLYWQGQRSAIDLSEHFHWSPEQTELCLPNNGKLSYSITKQAGINVATWQSAEIEICYRRGGERIDLPGRRGSHALKKLFQEAAIPPWQRAQMPLVYLDGNLAAIADKWVSSDYFQQTGGDNIQLKWCLSTV